MKLEKFKQREEQKKKVSVDIFVDEPVVQKNRALEENTLLEKESFDIRVENERLKEENEILRQKMDALLTFIKEHKDTQTENTEAVE